MRYEDYTWPMRDPKKRPFEHQKRTVEFLLENKRCFNLSDIGTGKTLSSLWACDILFENKLIKKVLIVSTLTSLQLVWASEIFENFPHLYYSIAHGSKTERIRMIQSDVHFVIINHDGVQTVLNELIAEKFDIVIIDESTAYKNAGSDRSKTARKLVKNVRGVWSITGNPRPNSPVEVFSQAKITVPNNPYLPQYFTQFRDMVVQEVVQGVWVSKPNANAIVHAVLQPAIRFTRDECLDIPPVLYQYVDGSMSKEQGKAYEEMRKNLYIQYDKGEITASNAGVKMLKLLQISAGTVRDNEGKEVYYDDSEKINVILETFEELGRTKLIVVAAYVGVVNRLCQHFKDKKIRCDVIYGDVPLKRRTEIVNDFQNGDLQILVVQPQATSHSITLTAASTIIWHSYVASGEVYGQMNGRITRAGQKKKQFVKHLINSKAEKRVVEMILNPKMKESQCLLDMFRNREL
jgi:SNF2 family DNA or RNA helicase